MTNTSIAVSFGISQAFPSFGVGDSVMLRSCRHGEPGRVIRLERGKVVILWPDLDYIGRHSPASLIIVGPRKPDGATSP